MYSPDGKILAFITMSQDGALCYRVTYDVKEVIQSSSMGIIVDGDTLGKNSKIKFLKKSVVRETYPTRGFHTEATGNAIEYSYEAQSSGSVFIIQFRLYDDGVAFRYVVPGNGKRLINGELTTFDVLREIPVWFFERPNHWKLKSYAGEWRRTMSDSLATVSPTGAIQGAPLLYELPDGKYLAITEAALYNYSGMRLKANPDASLQVDFNEQDGFNVKDTVISPWRVIMLADDLNELVNSDIITNLNPASDPLLFAQTEWIQPGRSLWSWWSKGADYLTIESEKHVIDCAAKLNYEYTLIDEGWERNWSDKWLQLKELCDYAKQKQVGVIVWKHSNEIRNPADDYAVMHHFLDSVSRTGVAGVKIDFMNGETKEIIDFDIRALQMCAERRLIVDFHGCQKPSGEARTYPNEITREGVRGLELNLMSEGPLPARHNVALVFTRCILNNTDYTPIGFSKPGTTTWTHQLATAYAITSPLTIIAEHPDTLLKSKALPLLKALPTVWDETVILPESSVSETAVMARRKGNKWFLIALNGDKPKQLHIKTDFLKAGRWHVLTAQDNPERQDDIIIKEFYVNQGDTVTMNLCSEGGYVAMISKQSVSVGEPEIVYETPYLCDHTIVFSPKEKQWHLFGITEGHKHFIHLTADSILQTPWKKCEDFIIEGNELEIWAPHVIFHDDLFYMFYTVVNEPREIRYSISKDLYHWEHPEHNLLLSGKNDFTENMKNKDPMVFKDKERWIMYFSMMKDNTHWVVGYSTSRDLINWTEPDICFDENSESPGVESPFVVQQGDNYYLFLSARPWPFGGVDIFRSKTPLSWKATDKVGRIVPWHAAEIVSESDKLYITLSSNGVQLHDFKIAELKWIDE
jgi:alpha-glucosidase